MVSTVVAVLVVALVVVTWVVVPRSALKLGRKLRRDVEDSKKHDT